MVHIPTQRTSLWVSVILIGLILLHYVGWLSGLENIIRSLVIPELITFNTIRIKVGDEYRWFRNRAELTQAAEQCFAESRAQAVTTANYKLVQDENRQLRELLDYKKKDRPSLIVAAVIGKSADNIDQTVLIDHGSNEGVITGAPVIAETAILIGKILKVNTTSAVVRLLNDNQSKLAATVLNRDKSLGVVEGGFGLSLRMKFIPRNESVAVGAQIVTSGLELGIPRGLLIGTVAAVENEAYQPFQQAVLTPATALDKLTLVSVIVSHP